MLKALPAVLAATAILAIAVACGGPATPTAAPSSGSAGVAPTPGMAAALTPVAPGTVSPVSTPAVTPPTAIATAAPSTEATPAPEPTPAVQQRLRANLGGEPSSLDPQLASSLLEFSVVRQLFRGLLGFKPDLTLEAVVAEEVPTVENGGISPDGTSYTFHLRDGVTWSDGKRLTAGDFVYSIKRLLDPETAGPYSQFYTVIRGGTEYNGAAEAGASAREELRGAVAVEAPDESTLRITLAEPNPTFLQMLALVSAYPVRQDVVDNLGTEWTEAGNLVGNGPFVLAEWVHQDRITLEANPNYWGPPPKLERITYRMIADANAELAAYRNDELDLAKVPPGTERAILDDPDLRDEILRSTQLFSLGLFFNVTSPPFDRALVRRAFATAIDREGWVDKVKNGVGQAATGWLPPGMPGFDPDLGREYTFNPERARELLAEAGYPQAQGFPAVSLTYVDAGDQRVMAQFVQAQMQDNLGVEVSLEPLDPPAYGQQVIGGHQFQSTLLTWGADYPDPENFLATLFATGSFINISGYSDPEFDELALLAATELDQPARIELWERAHAVMLDDAPVAPFFYVERFYLKKPRVEGLTLTGIDGEIPGDTRLAEVFLGP